MKRTALISVSEKPGIVKFAQRLVATGVWDLASIGGTYDMLKDAGLTVTNLADITGGIWLDHKVATLWGQVHGGLLADATVDGEIEELEKMGGIYFDLAIVDFYPLEAEIAKPGATRATVTAKTDIGGPTMVRSAAKGRRIVIADPGDRDGVLEWLEAGEPDPEAFRDHLAAKAEFIVAGYALASARYISNGAYDGMIGHLIAPCKGENAYQTPAGLYTLGTDDPLGPDRFKLIEGAAPSHNNWWEMLERGPQYLTRLAATLDVNYGRVSNIAIVTKHGNACGAAEGDDPVDVIHKTVIGDPEAIFGGLLITNFVIDATVATELRHFGVGSGPPRILDGITAPGFTPQAIEILRRPNGACRFVVNPALAELSRHSLDTGPRLKAVRGGFLLQPNYSFVLDLLDPELMKTQQLSPSQERALLLAVSLCGCSVSNTISLTLPGVDGTAPYLIGNGVGQMKRVGCCKLAAQLAREAGHDLAGAIAASDSFYPFKDGPQVLIDAGIVAIWSTTGSIRDGEVQELCRSTSTALYQLPDAKARVFLH